MTELDTAIRKQIAAFVAGQVEAADLAGWLETEMWTADDEPVSVRDLGNEASRLLAETANGDWSEGDLRERLGALSRNYWLEVTPRRTWTGSGDLTRHSDHSAGAGRPRVVAFA